MTDPTPDGDGGRLDALSPGLLVASPQLKDPFFAHTVVLLCRHEDDGAMGVVINRPTEMPMVDVLSEVPFDLDEVEDRMVMWGGPVEPSRGTIVFRTEMPDDEEFLDIEDRVRVSGSMEVLKRLVRDDPDSDDWFLALGYAGWGPGQLDREIEEGSWIVLPVEAATMFELPVDERYDRCIASLGVDSAMIFMNPVDE